MKIWIDSLNEVKQQELISFKSKQRMQMPLNSISIQYKQKYFSLSLSLLFILLFNCFSWFGQFIVFKFRFIKFLCSHQIALKPNLTICLSEKGKYEWFSTRIQCGGALRWLMDFYRKFISNIIYYMWLFWSFSRNVRISKRMKCFWDVSDKFHFKVVTFHIVVLRK